MKLFKQLASIYSGSGKEQVMIQFIVAYVKNNIKEAKVSVDETGNIYIIKGESETYPCVVAHLDQVQRKYPKDYTVLESELIISAYSTTTHSFCGLGADDKCGIWIALKALEEHSILKVALFPGEEVGCVGSSAADMNFFDDVRFVIEPDRRGASDLITSIAGLELCSDKFLKDIKYQSFGYSTTSGLMTDVETLKDRGLKVSCVNISCGYYSPHTENEYVIKKDMENAYDFVSYVIENCTDVYLHEATYNNLKYANWKYNDFGYSTSWSAKSGDDVKTSYKDPIKNIENLSYDEQIYEMYNLITDAVWDNPLVTAYEIYSLHKDEFNKLNKWDIESIFDEVYLELNSDDLQDYKLD